MRRVNVVDSPPGMHEAVEALELLGLAHLDDVRAERAQHRRVLAEVALNCENADPEWLHGGRWYRRGPAGLSFGR